MNEGEEGQGEKTPRSFKGRDTSQILLLVCLGLFLWCGVGRYGRWMVWSQVITSKSITSISSSSSTRATWYGHCSVWVTTVGARVARAWQRVGTRNPHGAYRSCRGCVYVWTRLCGMERGWMVDWVLGHEWCLRAADSVPVAVAPVVVRGAGADGPARSLPVRP